MNARKRTLLAPLVLFVLPFFALTGPTHGIGFPITNETSELHHFRPLGVALGLVLLVELAMAGMRRWGKHDPSPPSSALVPRALVVLGALALVFEWPLQLRLSGHASVLLTRPDLIALAIALAALATSRIGPWSGLLALASGEWAAGAFVEPWLAFKDDADHMTIFILEILGAVLLTIFFLIVILYVLLGEEALKSGDFLKKLKERDIGFVPLAVAVFAKAVSRVTLDVDGLRSQQMAFGFGEAWAHFDTALLALSLGVARQVEVGRGDLERAGLRTIFREHELALVPWALATAVKWLVGTRLAIAQTGLDPTVSMRTAAEIYSTQIPTLAFYAVWTGSLAGLKTWLRWTNPPALQEAPSSSHPDGSSPAPGPRAAP